MNERIQRTALDAPAAYAGVMWRQSTSQQGVSLNKYHECDFLPSNGISIVYTDSFLHGQKDVWNLVVEREATEEDLEENHHLENIGDSIWQTIVEIYCCPFCGCSLSKSKDKDQSGNFIHLDSSGWNIRIC